VAKKPRIPAFEIEVYSGTVLPQTAKNFLAYASSFPAFDAEKEFELPVATLGALDISSSWNNHWVDVPSMKEADFDYLFEVGFMQIRPSHTLISACWAPFGSNSGRHAFTPKAAIIPKSMVRAREWNASHPDMPIVCIEYNEQYGGREPSYPGNVGVSTAVGFLFHSDEIQSIMAWKLTGEGNLCFRRPPMKGDPPGGLSHDIHAENPLKVPWSHVQRIDTFGLGDWEPTKGRASD
jgi:hypothetical protein